MDIKFNYDQPDIDVVPVADAIRAHYRLPELTPEQQQQRRIDYEIFREEQAWAEAERRAERERIDAKAEGIARHEAALEQAERNRVARLELQKRQREQDLERRLVGLQIRARQQEVWQSNVENAARTGIAQRYRNSLMGELDAMINPPQPQREPESVVFVADDGLGSPNIADDNFNAGYWLNKPIFK
jgi:hypothetical protein